MRVVFLVLLIAISFHTFSQTEITTNDYRLLIGPVLDSKGNYTVSEMVGHDASGFYVIRSKKTGMFGRMSFAKNGGGINEKAKFFLEKYDYAFKLIKSVNLEEAIELGGFDYHFIEYQNNSLYAFISSYNSSTKTRILYSQEISKETLEFLGKPAQLYENDDLRSSSFKGEFYASEISPDGNNYFLLIEKDIKNNDTRTLQLLSFDKEFNKQWENELIVPLPGKYVEIKSMQIDNYNQAHVLIKIKNDIDESLNQFKLYSVLQNGKVSKEMTLNISDKSISAIQSASFNEDELVCAGFYSNKTYGSVDGTFYFKIDFTRQQILEERYKEFDIDFITQYMKDKKAEKLERKEEKGKDVEMPDYKLDELIINEDGSIYLVAEQFRIDVVTTYSQYGGTTTTYYFNYNDIVIVNFNADGNVKWMTKIPKTQRSASDEGFYSSYSMIMNEDNLFFIYNDNMDNYALDDVKKIKNYVPISSGSATIISRINALGDHTKEVLLYNQQLDAIIKPTISHHLSQNELILYGHRGTNQNFIAVDLIKH